MFGIQFFWQMPHFLAIAWLYRAEYARAGFHMLAVYDETGVRTGLQAVSHAWGLLVMSLSPFVLGLAGRLYLLGALLLGLGFLGVAVQFARARTPRRARWLFLASIGYLPLLLSLMILDKAR